MALDSPIVSDQDSLIEQEPLETEESISNENQDYSTFTRKRPVYLSNSLQRNKRQSLMSPQSNPNLDVDGVRTPDFAMTQSMYEPLEKRKQQEKLEENSRLLKLIASEKTTQAAKDRKIKEMKKKAIENKKRNEEKQKLFEERRLRMLADQEEKKNKILKKINFPSPITTSYYGNMTKNGSKLKTIMGSGFMDKRPVASTGKIFGFGSSAPRDVCDTFYSKKLLERETSLIETRKPDQPISRMCASQIVHSTNSREPKLRVNNKENTVKPMSSSIVNVSSFNKALIKKRKATASDKGDNSLTRPKPRRPVTPEQRSPRILNSTSDQSKAPFDNHAKSTEKHRGRSAEKVKPSSNFANNSEPRSRTADRKKTPVIQVTSELLTEENKHKKSTKPDKIKRLKPTSDHLPSLKKHPSKDKSPSRKIPSIPPARPTEPPKKFEVRFEHKENVKEDDSNLLSESSISTDRPRSSTSNLTEDEYKQRIALQRKLAKEKRRKEQEEKELRELKKLNDMKTPDPIDQPVTPFLTTDDGMNSEMSEANVGKTRIDSSSSSEPAIKDVVIDKSTKKDGIFQYMETPTDDNGHTTSATIPTIELPKVENPVEMTASVEALDRIERKRRIDSIMSRIKKPIGGSSENVTHHMSTTTLQDMLNKGHLSGMSKTAAILMKNSHQASDISLSATDLHNTMESKQSYSPADLNSKSQDISVPPENIEESRGSCDGQEDLVVPSHVQESLATKEDLMGNLLAQSNKPYLSSWAEKYSDSLSLDTEDDKTE